MGFCRNVSKFAPKIKQNKLMRRFFGLLGVAVSIVLLCSSCLNGDDAESATYNDMAIISFSLGTMNRYLHTTSSTGADSVYKKTYTGSDYSFHIDQVNRQIFNTDSLPVGTDLEHVLCSISTLNGGAAYFKGINNDSLYYYSDADSIDCSQPRKIRVYARDSQNYSTYTLRINVHLEEADEFRWSEETAYSDEAQEYLEDLQNIQTRTQEAGLKQYIGRSTTERYAYTDDYRIMVSIDDGETWTDDILDESATWLPTQDIACGYHNYSTYNDIDYVLLVGRRDATAYPNDKGMQVWHKIVDYSLTPQVNKWAFMGLSDNNTLYLPLMTSPSLFWYNGKAVCIGLCESELVAYESKDGGITWKESASLEIPDKLQTGNPVTAFVDSKNFIWIEQPATGQLWRGRLNKLGWAQ